jgi:sarcosine oxidase
MNNNTASAYDVIVVGVGAMGSSTCAFLAARGAKVLGLEQFDIVHERGSHTGQSRIIRKAYFEHPDYVPLLERSYFNWQKLEAESCQKIYFETGIVYFGKPEGEIISGITKSGLLYDINLEKLTPEQTSARFPAFEIPANFNAIFEPEAGYLIPEKAIRLYVEKARQHGAVIKENEAVLTWSQNESNVEVTTPTGSYVAKKIVFTSGSWMGKLLPELTSMLTVRRQLLAWIQPPDKKQFDNTHFPCWFVEDPVHGLFYGFPRIENGVVAGPSGIKLAHHHPGVVTDPDDRDEATSSQIPSALSTAIDKYIPSAGKDFSAVKQCLYTYSPDSDFIIDFLPNGDDRVVIACGFSGHGFKFASVVGEILADLALDGNTALPIDFLRLDRLKIKKQ